MAKATSTPSVTKISWPAGIFGTYSVIGPQIAHFWEAQEDILTDGETFARNWFERRHTATRTALEAAMEIGHCGVSDPAGAMKAVTRWQTHSMERVAQDYREWLGLWTRCAGYLNNAEMEAGEEGMKSVAKSMTPAKRMKDDIPV